jgi:hypothetical protein
MKHVLVLDERAAMSLLKIVKYLHDDEARHYEESGKPRNHIFRDVARIEKLLTHESSITQ